jgi:hypothetical protein
MAVLQHQRRRVYCQNLPDKGQAERSFDNSRQAMVIARRTGNTSLEATKHLFLGLPTPHSMTLSYLMNS